MNISQTELRQLQSVEQLTQQKKIELDALMVLSQTLIRGMTAKNGCDKNKQWEISLDSGDIREAKKSKQEEVKEQAVARKKKKHK